MFKKSSNILKRIAAVILVFFAVTGAFPVQPIAQTYKTGIIASADTTEVEITSVADWDNVANNVNAYKDKTLILKNDIKISKMIGSKTNHFQGTFDGNGHTLTLDGEEFGTEETPNTKKYCAPFSYTDMVTIKNLTVAGTIYTKVDNTKTSDEKMAGKFASGLIGSMNGNSTIDNCHVCIEFHSIKAENVKTDSVDGTHGMFIGIIETSQTVTINNCYFDGVVYAPDTINCGGFVGYNKGTVNFKSCLFSPSLLESYHGKTTDYSSTFARLVNNSTSCCNTFENTYYTVNWGSVDKDAIYADTNNPIDISKAVITLSQDSFVYDGFEKSVTYTAKLGDITLTEGKDFYFEGDLTAVQSDTYIVKIKGKNIYSGNAYTTWKIVKNFNVKVDIDGNCNSISYPYRTSATVEAPSIDGKDFSHWEIDGKNVSTTNTYTFVVLGDTEIKAVYYDDQKNISTTKLTMKALQTTYNRKNAVRFVYNRSIPAEYTVKEVGLFYATNKLLGVSGHANQNLTESNEYGVSGYEEVKNTLLTKDTVKKYVGKNKLNEGTLEFKYAVGNNTDAYVYTIGYVKVINIIDNTEATFYTDVIATSYNDI